MSLTELAAFKEIEDAETLEELFQVVCDYTSYGSISLRATNRWAELKANQRIVSSSES